MVQIPVLPKPFEFVVLTSLIAAKVGLYLLWHISSRIPYKIPSIYQKTLATTFPAGDFPLNLSSLRSPFSNLRLPFFGRLKGAQQGRRLADDEKLQHRVSEELRLFSKEFYTTYIERLTQMWKSVLIAKDTLWKNNINFERNVPKK